LKKPVHFGRLSPYIKDFDSDRELFQDQSLTRITADEERIRADNSQDKSFFAVESTRLYPSSIRFFSVKGYILHFDSFHEVNHGC
jgi:hypothetical protein